MSLPRYYQFTGFNYLSLGEDFLDDSFLKLIQYGCVPIDRLSWFTRILWLKMRVSRLVVFITNFGSVSPTFGAQYQLSHHITNIQGTVGIRYAARHAEQRFLYY